MENKDRIDGLLNISKGLTLDEFDSFVSSYLTRKADKNLALNELDSYLASMSNQILLFSLHLKQNYLLQNKQLTVTNEEELLFTKKEIAKKYKVNGRTVSNWIKDGLETIEIGGVLRISKKAVERFCEYHKTKKFNWKSISR